MCSQWRPALFYRWILALSANNTHNCANVQCVLPSHNHIIVGQAKRMHSWAPYFSFSYAIIIYIRRQPLHNTCRPLHQPYYLVWCENLLLATDAYNLNAMANSVNWNAAHSALTHVPSGGYPANASQFMVGNLVERESRGGNIRCRFHMESSKSSLGG